MKRCKNCYYYDLCINRKMCRYYDPIVNIDEFEDELIEQALLKEKQEYIHDWNIYVKQYERD